MSTAFPTYQIKGKTVEYKTFPFEVKSVDQEQGTITGYLSTFGNVDLGNDRVLPGAFKKTIADAYGRKQNGRKVLFPLLWMHDPEKPIGGFTDAAEDAHGLLCTAQLDISTNAAGIPNNPLATMAFSGFKAGYIDELSIGYIAVQKSYDKQGVRDLKECALIEGSSVTMNFAMNPEALVPASGVKTATKGASGKTTWPLAPRDTTWDSGQATKDIEAWANGDWAKVAQCFFWVAASPPTTLADCKLPFVAKVGDTMQAVPQGIISGAGVLQGAMGGVSIPEADRDAVKAKIATYYAKMDMTPPWDDDSGKRRRMTTTNRKDFNDHYRQECIEDWLWMDFRNLTAALQAAVMDIFLIGDTPQTDVVDTILEGTSDGSDDPGNVIGFIDALKAYVQKGIDLDVSNYLSQQLQSYGCAPDSILYYMSRDPHHATKATKSGAAFSQANKDALNQHAAEMKALCDQHAALSGQLAQVGQAMQQKVSDLTQVWQEEGQGPAYSNDSGASSSSSASGNDTRKSTVSPRREPRALRTLPRDAQPPERTAEFTLDDLAALLV